MFNFFSAKLSFQFIQVILCEFDWHWKSFFRYFRFFTKTKKMFNRSALYIRYVTTEPPSQIKTKTEKNNFEMCSHFASMIFPYLYLPLSLSLYLSKPCGSSQQQRCSQNNFRPQMNDHPTVNSSRSILLKFRSSLSVVLKY